MPVILDTAAQDLWLTPDTAPAVLKELLRFDYVAPDAVVIGNRSSDSPFVGGYDFKRLALGTTRVAVTKLISDAAFAATFFRRYWLILEASENDANDVVSSVEDLDLGNIGVARFEAGKQDDLDLLRSPKGEPTPNRKRSLFERSAGRVRLRLFISI